MSKRVVDLGESLHVCNYNGCGRAFDNPVRLTDFSRKPHLETYYACPHCFSKVNEAFESEYHDVEDEVKHLQERDNGTFVAEEDTRNLKSGRQKELTTVTTDVNCPHRMGYLKTRPKDEAVPDGCLTCPNILQCMA